MRPLASLGDGDLEPLAFLNRDAKLSMIRPSQEGFGTGIGGIVLVTIVQVWGPRYRSIISGGQPHHF